MTINRTRNLIIIGVLLAAVVYILFPNNPGITIGSFSRDFKTKLGLDLRGGLRVLLEADLPADSTISPQTMEDAKQILENRANGLGVSEVLFETAGQRRLVGEFPGLTETGQVISVLKQVGQLAFIPAGSQPLPEGTKIQVDYTKTVDPNAPTNAPAPAADGTIPEGAVYTPLFTGDELSEVGVSLDKVGKPYINFSLKSVGTKSFADFTSKHTGEYLAIVLDNVVISSPVIKNPITGGSGIIEGGFTVDSANALAIQLRYGSLPIPFKVVDGRTVGASLGQDSINKSLIAGLIGLLMVVLFMGIYYRLPGVVADVALVIYAATTFALFKLIPVTLTLPGIAGFVLSIGVAVDANILIFSRLKEELRSGRTLEQAIDLGWKRAWPSIRDSNISTIITCAILFWFGSAFGASIVKGFALTLAIGVLVSLFTAIFVTRTLLHLVLDNLRFTEHPRWFMAPNPPQTARHPKVDIIGRRYLYFAISLLVIIPGMIALGVWGLPLSIDFVGGSELEVSFAAGHSPQPAQIIQLYSDMGVPGTQVQSSLGDLFIIRSKEISEDEKSAIVKEMEARFGGTITVSRFDTVGPSIGKEVAGRAAGAVGLASIGILGFIMYAFRGVKHAFRYGVAAILAMLHDVAVVIGIGALLGHFLHWEMDSLFLTALLTIIGFSVHDTIVVFDRIRENLTLFRFQSFTTMVNHSTVQTMDRSINTQLTVMMTLLAMALFGGQTIHAFVITLLIGVLSGTYSSIFNAAPILVVWENREWRSWFRRPVSTEIQ
jgi:protein-export membrane protein SecD/preprotein translocase SecF subunit